MENLYIGVDPSINSTGVTIRRVVDGDTVEVLFYIIKGNLHEIKKDGTEKSPLTSAEIKCANCHTNFHYILYNKHAIDPKLSNAENERLKTTNFINIVNKVKEVIDSAVFKFKPNNIYIVQEGISYGSATHTKSIFDLAGLNFLLRKMIADTFGINTLIIASPSEIKKFATGLGNAKKELLIATFLSIFEDMKDVPKVDDIADSYFMARLGETTSLN